MVISNQKEFLFLVSDYQNKLPKFSSSIMVILKKNSFTNNYYL